MLKKRKDGTIEDFYGIPINNRNDQGQFLCLSCRRPDPVNQFGFCASCFQRNIEIVPLEGDDAKGK